jgi:Zn-dependent protease with chaperone function
MHVLVYLPLLIPAVAAAAARPLGARLEPSQATWLLTAATVALAACSTAALGLLAVSAAARAPVLALLGDYSQQVLRRGDPVSAVIGISAAVLLTGAAVAVAVLARRRARALAESYRRAARMHTGDDVVVVPGPAIEAYALPGWPGQIVVSGRLLATLDDRARAALLAHERAHLSSRHYLFTTVAHLAAAANPLLLPLARTVDYTVERWADEHAAWWPPRSAGSPCWPPAAPGGWPPGCPALPARSAGGSRWPGRGRYPGGSPPCSPRLPAGTPRSWWPPCC